MTKVSQPTKAPTRKVAAGGVAGAIVFILVWVVGLFGLDVPPEAAAAATVVVAALVAYLKRDGLRGGVPPGREPTM